MVINPNQEAVYYLDSQYGVVRKHAKDLVEAALLIHRGSKPANRQRDNIRWFRVKCPRQPNGNDCAYYVMRYLGEIVDHREDLTSLKFFDDQKSYSQEDIDQIRCELARYVRFYAQAA